MIRWVFHYDPGDKNAMYLKKNIFEDPSCIHIENGCFIADPVCKR